jgi:hypothetical protein
VTEVPGLVPTFPTKTPEPVLVNVELARATKVAAEPKLGATAAAGLAWTSGKGPPTTTKSVVNTNKIVKFLSIFIPSTSEVLLDYCVSPTWLE